MRFRPLRIDYMAEAVEILREERLREWQRCEERRDGGRDESFASFTGLCKRNKKRRVIRIVQEPPEEELLPPDQQEKDGNANTTVAIAVLPPWLSSPSDGDGRSVNDNDTQQVGNGFKNDHNKTKCDHEIDPTTGNNNCAKNCDEFEIFEPSDKVHCVDSSDPLAIEFHPLWDESRRNGRSPTDTDGRLWRPLLPTRIDHRVFFNNPWMLALVSSIRRFATQKRICQYQQWSDALYRHQHGSSCSRFSANENSTNDAFSHLFIRIRQQTLNENIPWQSCGTSPKWLQHDKKEATVANHTGVERSNIHPCRSAESPHLSFEIRSALSLGSFASRFPIGSRRSPSETRKRTPGALVEVGGATNSANGANIPTNVYKDRSYHSQNTNEEEQQSKCLRNQELQLYPSPTLSRKLLETAMMTAHIVSVYRQQEQLRRTSNAQSGVESLPPARGSGVAQDASFETIRDKGGSPRILVSPATATAAASSGLSKMLPGATTMQNANEKADDVVEPPGDRNERKNWSRFSSRSSRNAEAHLSKRLFGSSANAPASNLAHQHSVNDLGISQDDVEHNHKTPMLAGFGIKNRVGIGDRSQNHQGEATENRLERGKEEEESVNMQFMVQGESTAPESWKIMNSSKKSMNKEDGTSSDCGNNSTTLNDCPQKQLPTKEGKTNPPHTPEPHPFVAVKQKERTLLQRFGLLSRSSPGNNTGIALDGSNEGGYAIGNDDYANDDTDGSTATPVHSRDVEKSVTDGNGDPSSPFEFPVCLDYYEEEIEEEEDKGNGENSWNYLPSSDAFGRPPEQNQFNEVATQSKRERKRTRREQKKRRKKQKRSGKRRRKETPENVRPEQKHQHRDLHKTISEGKPPNDGEGHRNSIDNDELEHLETPKKLEHLSPAKALTVQRNPEDVLDGTNLCNNDQIRTPRVAGVRTFVQDNQIRRDENAFQTPQMLESQAGDVEENLDDDPFYVSPEEIQQANKDCSTMVCVDMEASHDGNVAETAQNGPMRLLCSESFLEKFGDVVADLARGAVGGNESMQEQAPIRFTDTDLMDVCGVDIETPLRGAILVSTLSQIQASGDHNALLTSFLPRIIELAATTRYCQLTVLLCIDTELDADVSQGIVRLQTAFLSDGGDIVTQRTSTSIQLTSRACLASCIARTILDSDSSQFLTLSNQDHWLSDQRACERLKFLLTIVPTLSVSGALQWLDSSQSWTGQSSEHSVEEDRSVEWFQHLFQSVEEESNRVKSLLLQSSHPCTNRQLQNWINPHVPQQLVAVVGARLNSFDYS